MKRYNEWMRAKDDLKKVNDWMMLPNGKKYSSTDTFEVSISQSKLNLVRAGQQYQGSASYWNSPTMLNNSLLEIIKTDKSILDRAVKLCEEKVRKAKLACREEVKKVLKEIEEEK